MLVQILNIINFNQSTLINNTLDLLINIANTYHKILPPRINKTRYSIYTSFWALEFLRTGRTTQAPWHYSSGQVNNRQILGLGCPSTHTPAWTTGLNGVARSHRLLLINHTTAFYYSLLAKQSWVSTRH